MTPEEFQKGVEELIDSVFVLLREDISGPESIVEIHESLTDACERQEQLLSEEGITVLVVPKYLTPPKKMESIYLRLQKAQEKE